MVLRAAFSLLLAFLLESAVSTSVARSEGTAGAAAGVGLPRKAAPTPSLRGRSLGAAIPPATSGGVVWRALSSAASDDVEDTGSFIDFIDQTEPQSSLGLLSDTDDGDDDGDSDSSSTTVLAAVFFAAFLSTAMGGFYWYVRKSGGRRGGGSKNNPKEQQQPAGGAGGGVGESVSGPRAVKPSKSLRRFFMTAPSATSPSPCRTPAVSEGARACPPTPAILGAVGSDFLATGAVNPSRRVRRPRSARSSRSGSSDRVGGQRTAESRRSGGGRGSARRSGREPGREVSGDHVLGGRHPHEGVSEKTLSASSSTLQTSFASSASSSSFSSSFSSSSSSFSEASEPPTERQHQQHGRPAPRRPSGDVEDPDYRPGSPLPRKPQVAKGGRDHYGRAPTAPPCGAHGPPQQEPTLNNLGLARKFYAPPSSPTPAGRKHSFSGQYSANRDRVCSPERTNADVIP